MSMSPLAKAAAVLWNPARASSSVPTAACLSTYLNTRPTPLANCSAPWGAGNPSIRPSSGQGSPHSARACVAANTEGVASTPTPSSERRRPAGLYTHSRCSKQMWASL